MVEACVHLTVPDLLTRMTPEEREKPVYVLPEAPSVILVRAPKGSLRTWHWIICPRCRSRREALHRLPFEPADAWRCTA